MIAIDRIRELLNRLWNATCITGEWNVELWRRGVDKLKDKHHFEMYLSGFEPAGMIETPIGEAIDMKVEITPTLPFPSEETDKGRPRVINNWEDLN